MALSPHPFNSTSLSHVVRFSTPRQIVQRVVRAHNLAWKEWRSWGQTYCIFTRDGYTNGRWMPLSEMPHEHRGLGGPQSSRFFLLCCWRKTNYKRMRDTLLIKQILSSTAPEDEPLAFLDI